MQGANKTPKSYATQRYKGYYNNTSEVGVTKKTKTSKVQSSKVNAPTKSRQIKSNKAVVPTKQRQAQNSKRSIPSKARQTTSIQTQRKQRSNVIHRNIKNARIVKSVKPSIKYKYEIDKNSKLSFATWLSISVIFIGAIVCLYLNASITQKMQNINSITKQTTKQGEINANMRVKISNSYDLINIEKIASVKLGMSKPQEYQIINIDVPKESYIVQYSPKDEETKSKKKFSFSSIKDFITIKKN